ncbi:MAG: HNH endonuclease domain-containing protein [Myxococcota bacterium]|jgi:hypothetical protein|nr:HNH endonuclease domain-containing protein [Myxococcota bacterium]
MKTPGDERGIVELAEQTLALLDQGQFVATYKYAVLLGILDLCLEGTARHGAPPQSLTTRQLAAKVIELYWPQTRDFVPASAARDSRPDKLRQCSSGSVILDRIVAFRTLEEGSLEQVARRHPGEYLALLDDVEWKLIEMPLPRLQLVGREEQEFLYRIDWCLDRSRRGDVLRSRDVDGPGAVIREGVVRRYQAAFRQAQLPGEPAGSGGFSNVIRLLPGVAERLVLLNSLLRPIIQRKWADKVAELNRERLGDSDLDEFLFGCERVSTRLVRPALRDLQRGDCFYCGQPVPRGAEQGEVDHFLPWSRYPDNGIHNLVLAHRRCNQHKRDFLAAGSHLQRWVQRNWTDPGPGAQLAGFAEEVGWESHPARTLGVARGIYLRLPRVARLWLEEDEFEAPDPALLEQALG